jgi:hypothetical protein
LVQFVSYEEKEVLCFWALVKELHFLGNLWIGPISLSVTKDWARKACQGQTFKLIGPIRKLRRKRCALFPGFIQGTTFYFICNLRISPISLSVTKHWVGKACQG